MQLFYHAEAEKDNVLTLEREESKHLAKVLRMKANDHIHLTNGRGDLFRALIISADPAAVVINTGEPEHHKSRKLNLHIAMAPTKNIKRSEWFVEKAVELGIEKISFFSSRYSGRTQLKIPRMQKIAASAMKQSLKFYLPELSGVRKLEDVILDANEKNKWIAHCHAEQERKIFSPDNENQDHIVLIGPEGGFHPEEIQLARQHGFTAVELSPYRLRTETAALTACQWLNIQNSYYL